GPGAPPQGPSAAGRVPGGLAGPRGGGGPGGAGPGGGPGGLLNAGTPDAAVTAALNAGAASYTWVAAAVGSNTAAGYQLATGRPVMAVGGFNGTDPAPTLAEFQRLARQGRIHYFVGGARGQGRAPGGGRARGAGSGSDAAQQISAWVAAHYTPATVGGTVLYDLTPGAG
ncbi:glycosyl transferase, partial [Actinomadura sp. NPDC049753]